MIRPARTHRLRRPMSTALVVCLGLVGGSCFSPDLGEGAIQCGPGGSCPPAYRCARGACYRGPGPGDDLGAAVDLTGSDLASSNGDLAGVPLLDLATPPPDLSTCPTLCSPSCQGCCHEDCSNSGCNCASNKCTCFFSCSNSRNCAIACDNNAHCIATIDSTTTTVLGCNNKAACEFTCTGNTSCNLGCDNKASCLVRCLPPATCDIPNCQQQGQTCPDGSKVCNRDCP
jgi:hypothetical protein